MELNNPVLALGLIIILIGVIAIVFYVQIRLTSKLKIEGAFGKGKSRKTTYFLDEGEDEKKCEICYGELGCEDIAVCKCGKMFHKACAEPTRTCPYCNTSFEEMTIREPQRARCPVCGRFVKGSICECGAVLPRKDNTFQCSCGNRVDVNKPVCKKCGAVYENITMQTFKRKD